MAYGNDRPRMAQCHALRPRPDHEVVLRELGPGLFGSLARRDQQSTAVQYVHALLSTPGRKSVRNIARSVGGAAAAQRLHHFVSRSPWNWEPVRAATARHLVDIVAPDAWVVRRTVIPKAGRSSVGVGRAFDPGYGRVVNAQRVLDVWAASRRSSGPVDRDLLLPDAWLTDSRFRSAAEIPDHVGPSDVADAVVRMRDRLVDGWRLPGLPLVMDVRGTDADRIVASLVRRRIEFVVRITGSTEVRPDDGSGRSHEAGALLRWHGRRRRPVGPWPGGSREPASTAMLLTVSLPGSAVAGGEGSGLTLLGVGRQAEAWPAETWLTTVADPQVPLLLRYTRLLHHVEQEFTEANESVGLSDFTGRSFGGWHRHVTLATVAYMICQHLRAGAGARAGAAVLTAS